MLQLLGSRLFFMSKLVACVYCFCLYAGNLFSVQGLRFSQSISLAHLPTTEPTAGWHHNGHCRLSAAGITSQAAADGWSLFCLLQQSTQCLAAALKLWPVLQNLDTFAPGLFLYSDCWMDLKVFEHKGL